MEKFNVIVINEAGERVYPQGVDWDKLLNRLQKIGAILASLVTIIVQISTGSGGGFRIKRITITPTENQTRN
jgi:hypothetical protein